MIYSNGFTIGGVLVHGERSNHKYIDKIFVKGKWRYIYKDPKKAKGYDKIPTSVIKRMSQVNEKEAKQKNAPIEDAGEYLYFEDYHTKEDFDKAIKDEEFINALKKRQNKYKKH